MSVFWLSKSSSWMLQAKYLPACIDFKMSLSLIRVSLSPCGGRGSRSAQDPSCQVVSAQLKLQPLRCQRFRRSRQNPWRNFLGPGDTCLCALFSLWLPGESMFSFTQASRSTTERWGGSCGSRGWSSASDPSGESSSSSCSCILDCGRQHQWQVFICFWRSSSPSTQTSSGLWLANPWRSSCLTRIWVIVENDSTLL